MTEAFCWSKPKNSRFVSGKFHNDFFQFFTSIISTFLLYTLASSNKYQSKEKVTQEIFTSIFVTIRHNHVGKLPTCIFAQPYVEKCNNHYKEEILT